MVNARTTVLRRRGLTSVGAPPSTEGAVSTLDRRNRTPRGVARRARFESSLILLRALGLSQEAVGYYARLARGTQTLPHEFVCKVAENVVRQTASCEPVASLWGRPA